MSRWRLVTRGAHQGSALGETLFNIFINDVDSEIRGTLSKYADKSKLSAASDTLEGEDAIQNDLGKV